MNQHKLSVSVISIHSVIEYFFALLLILQFRSIYIYCDEFRWATDRIFVFGILLIVLICCTLKSNVSHRKVVNLMFIIVIVTIYISFHYVIKPYAFESMFKFLILIVSILIYHYLCENYDNRNELIYKYQNLICIIAFVSVVFWFFGSLLGKVHPSSIVHSSWTSSGANTVKEVASYYGLYFETQNIQFLGSFNVIRNTAIFTEGPMSSFHFVLALLIELFLRDRMSLKKVIFLILSVITTFGTIGIITAMLAITFKTILVITSKALVDNTRKSTWGYIKIFLIPVIIIVAIVTIQLLVETRIRTRSGSTRIDDFAAGYQAWRANPIFGNGYGNARSYQQYMSPFRKTNDGFSNSIMLVLVYGGVYLLVPYLYAGITTIRNCIKKKDSKLLVFFLLYLFMLTFTIGPFQALTVYMFVSFYSWSYYNC